MANSSKIERAPRRSWRARRCFAFSFASAFLLGGFPTEGSSIDIDVETKSAAKIGKHGEETTPGFKIGNEVSFELHDDQSYTILLPDGSKNKPALVTPVTIVYDYELQDGELLYDVGFLKNPGFDFAVLEVGSIRNLHRDTGEPVSLDEVYLHHLSVRPIHEYGSETLTNEYFNERLPDGYAMHILKDYQPRIQIAAHVLSNKNLAPINGSLELARKECNECYYAPGKGSNCKPKHSGWFNCCGHSKACMVGGEDCTCATTTTSKSTTTKYRMEVDFLVSREIEKFLDVNKWVLSAPSCEERKSSSCLNKGAKFHHVFQQPNEQPYFKSTASFSSPASGTLLNAQGHLHTGGVNVTLYRNREVVCTNTAEYGTNPDSSTNARNEQNHLVKLSTCYDQIPSTGIRLEIGDVLTTESYYHGGTGDTRFNNKIAAGEHKNVMSYMAVVLAFDEIKLNGHVDSLESNKKVLLWNDFTLQFSDDDMSLKSLRGRNNNN